MPTDQEVAWAAGLFEGEGCIGLWEHHRHKRPLVRLQIIMTDRDVLEKFCTIAECGKVSAERRTRQENRKPSFMWVISNRHDVDRLLRLFLPWLCARRAAKAQEVLAEIASADRDCKHCGTHFRPHRLDQLFCTPQCRLKWNYLHNRPDERPSQFGRPRTLFAPTPEEGTT